MIFDDLDKRMRVFETAHDHSVLPGIYIVARLDGRGFTRLTKEFLKLDAPYDERFRDAMLSTVEHVMQCGFNAVYSYVQSDEISVLLDLEDNTFGRKLRKLNSILAGEASASFALSMNIHAAFDCRICQLPTKQDVVDYFRWRHEDAHRNALNSHCYWNLRNEGLSEREATRELSGQSIAQKNEFLFQRGINFNELPAWQKRGAGIYWQDYIREGLNPITNETVLASRRELVQDLNLPMKDEHDQFIAKLLS